MLLVKLLKVNGAYLLAIHSKTMASFGALLFLHKKAVSADFYK